MGVEFYPCSICEEVGNDCEFMGHCVKCEGIIFDCCFDEQLKKYGRPKEVDDFWGEDVVAECDNCSDEERPNRIKKLKEQLAEEESKL